MNTPIPKRIAITGASGGIGRALSLAYAEEGAIFFLCGRNEERLQETAESALKAGATKVKTTIFDIRDPELLREWLTFIYEEAPLDLFIANAGVSSANSKDTLESSEETTRVLETNALASIDAIKAASDLMVDAGYGHIAVMSSIAALYPLASSPAYCAAKAASRIYGLALGDCLRSSGVFITVVCPGYVDTPMSQALSGPKPFLWTPEKAAAYIKKRLIKKPVEIHFPWILALGLRLASLLPHWISRRIMRRFAFKLKQTPKETIRKYTDSQ